MRLCNGAKGGDQKDIGEKGAVGPRRASYKKVGHQPGPA